MTKSKRKQPLKGVPVVPKELIPEYKPQPGDKHLFALRSEKTRHRVKDEKGVVLSFPNKMLAKKFRDKINELRPKDKVHVTKDYEHASKWPAGWVD